MALTKVIGNGLGAVTQDQVIGGDVTVDGSSAADLTIDAATDNAVLQLKCGTSDSGAESAFINFIQNTTNKWQMGMDTANDFYLYNYNKSASSMVINSNGQMTKPHQPAFLAQPTSQQSNLPINTNTTIVFGTERFDHGAVFASNTFTAPITGKYQLSVSLYVLNADIDANYFSSILETSNRNYSNVITTSSYDADLSYTSIAQSVLADMDANDTAYVYVNLPNQGAAQADIHTNSYFSGFLVC